LRDTKANTQLWTWFKSHDWQAFKFQLRKYEKQQKTMFSRRSLNRWKTNGQNWERSPGNSNHVLALPVECPEWLHSVWAKGDYSHSIEKASIDRNPRRTHGIVHMKTVPKEAFVWPNTDREFKGCVCECSDHHRNSRSPTTAPVHHPWEQAGHQWKCLHILDLLVVQCD